MSSRPVTLRQPGFSVMLAVLLAGAVFVFCVHRPLLNDPDIWWHLRNAQGLLEHYGFVRVDSYTSTIGGRPWINPEWLSEVVYYGAWAGCGYRGVEVVALGLIEAMLAGVGYLSWQRSGSLRPALVGAGAFLLFVTVSLGPRMQLFGWLCLIAELAVLYGVAQGRDRLWVLPPLFVLWVNLHGSWPVGLVLLVLFGVLEGGARRRKLVVIGALCVVAIFVNPYGWRLVVYPFLITTQHALTLANVQEWQSLDFHGFRGRAIFLLVAGLLVLRARSRRVWSWFDVACLGLSLLAALSYSRFLLFAGIVICPLLAAELGGLGEDKAELDKPLLNAAIIALVALFMVTHVPSTEDLRRDAEAGYPVGAVAYLKQAPGGGRLFNDFNWGGYVEWNVRETPVFIDTRADAFEQYGVFGDYLDVIQMKQPLETLEKYGVGRVLMPKDAPVVYLLKRTPGWRVAYEDATATVLERVRR